MNYFLNFGNRNYKEIIAITTLSMAMIGAYCFYDIFPKNKKSDQNLKKELTEHPQRISLCNKNVLENLIFE